MSSGIGVLAHYEPSTNRPTTHVPWEIAEVLLDRLVCERLTRKVIRMMPPESWCHTLKLDAVSLRYVPEKLPPREAPGCWFQLPKAYQWLVDHRTVTFAPRKA